MRRYVSPVLRLLLALFILAVPLLLAALAQAAETEPRALVTLRKVPLAARPKERFPSGPALAASSPATRLEARDGWLLVVAEEDGNKKTGWAEASAFLVLDDPAVAIEELLSRGSLFLAQGDRPALAIALASEAVRRDAARVDAWRLLGAAAEQLAASCRATADGSAPACVRSAARWGVALVQAGRPQGAFRYDGAAYRRLLALAPPPEVAEPAHVALLACGPTVDPDGAEEAALERRAADVGEYLAAFPASRKRVPYLLERARLLAALAQARGRRGDGAAAQAARDGAIESASEVAATADETRARRAADRLLLRMTRSFPKAPSPATGVVSPRGLTASFVERAGRTFLEVKRADGRPAIQPYPVNVPDPSTLVFDASGARLAWDEVPRLGRRTTRLLDLALARVTSPAAAAEGEVVRIGGGEAESRSDRYTSLVSFSPDGASLLVVTEGFSADGVRIPRRHVLCDAAGQRPPRVVSRPFASPGAVDWERLLREQPAGPDEPVRAADAEAPRASAGETGGACRRPLENPCAAVARGR
jgi:hypothetical protein